MKQQEDVKANPKAQQLWKVKVRVCRPAVEVRL